MWLHYQDLTNHDQVQRQGKGRKGCFKFKELHRKRYKDAGRLWSEGTNIYLRLINVKWQKPTQHCKAIIFQLNVFNLKINK